MSLLPFPKIDRLFQEKGVSVGTKRKESDSRVEDPQVLWVGRHHLIVDRIVERKR